MRPSRTISVLAALALASALHLLTSEPRADTRASQHYQVVADSIDLAGGGSSAANYAFQASLNDGGGPASTATGLITINQGYLIQLGEVVQTRPTLTVVLSGGSIVMLWPASGAKFNLETADTPAPAANWGPVLATPVLINGHFAVTNAVSDRSRFYRLRSP